MEAQIGGGRWGGGPRASLKSCRASLVAQTVKNLPAMQETWVEFLGQEDPPKEEMATHSSILVGRTTWIEELAGYSPWGHRDLHMTERPSPAEKD